MKKISLVLILLNVCYFSKLHAQLSDSVPFPYYAPNILPPSEDSLAAWIKTFQTPSITYRFCEYYYILGKDPEKKDSVNVKLYGRLYNTGPTKTNYKKFVEVANSLWQLNEIVKAEQMFTVVINSKQPYYTNTKYNSSGTPYGYGSFTSNYKNEAALALARINIQKKKYGQAFKYITAAVTKYKIYYTCGTGTMMYNNEIKALKSFCYYGLKMTDKGIRFLMAYALEGGYCCLPELLKQKYSSKQLVEMLNKAERSISFVQDKDSSTMQTSHYIPGDTILINESSTFLSATATIELFGYKIKIPSPELKDKEVATKEQFIAVFKDSAFYKDLTD